MIKKIIVQVGRRLAPKIFPQLSQTYRYRIEVTDAKGPVKKMGQLLESFWKVFFQRKIIIFFPEKPLPFCVIYKILLFLGIRIETDLENKCDLAIHYWHGFDGNPYATSNPYPNILTNKNRASKKLNFRCRDISKKQVNRVFEEVFGYSIGVNPRQFQGKCVMKSNWNALHKGKTVDCPREPEDESFVYQRLIHNETKDGSVEDMRVPVYGKTTPFVYLKYRPIRNRFIDRAHINTKVTMAEVDKVLSKDELANIYMFSERIGIDYGEVDVLRDGIDGRIYIVDANIAPSGPPAPITANDEKAAIKMLSRAFEEAFAPRKRSGWRK